MYSSKCFFICTSLLSIFDSSLPHAQVGDHVDEGGEDLPDHLPHLPAGWMVWLHTPPTPAGTKHVTGARNCHKQGQGHSAGRSHTKLTSLEIVSELFHSYIETFLLD